jgi:hypothetical protein
MRSAGLTITFAASKTVRTARLAFLAVVAVFIYAVSR